MKGGNFWFMTTDKAAQNISYTSTGAQRTYAVIHSNNSSYPGTGSNSWQTLLQNQGYTVEVCSTSSDMQTCLNAASISLDDVGVMILPGLGNTNIGYANSDIADWDL